MKKEERHSSDRIPILGHLPLIGILFGNTRSDEIESEIVILITPNILPDNGTVLKMIRDTRSPDQIKNKANRTESKSGARNVEAPEVQNTFKGKVSG